MTGVGRVPRIASTEAAGDMVVLPDRGRVTPVAIDADVLANTAIGDRYWRLDLDAPSIAARVAPGQFVMLTVTDGTDRGPVLPRPMAVYDVDAREGTVAIVYSVAGAGTRALTRYGRGTSITTVGPVGRQFDLPASGGVLLLGRGIGTCSLTLLARAAAVAGRPLTAVASGRHPSALIGADVYGSTHARYLPVLDSGGTSAPERLETRLHSLLDQAPPALVAACGSARLESLALRLADAWHADCQVAVEAHMACGLGYCHGCSTGARSASSEAPLVCRDGPVFRLRRSVRQVA
ncbi:MAG: hypothetical protein ACRDMV_22685 [Streptosporangiales bacterium]